MTKWESPYQKVHRKIEGKHSVVTKDATHFPTKKAYYKSKIDICKQEDGYFSCIGILQKENHQNPYFSISTTSSYTTGKMLHLSIPLNWEHSTEELPHVHYWPIWS